MQVGEVLPAIQAAKKAVFLNPKWWVAHQTLGRALMGVGEVKQVGKLSYDPKIQDLVRLE